MLCLDEKYFKNSVFLGNIEDVNSQMEEQIPVIWEEEAKFGEDCFLVLQNIQ
jgi:hypothetical protein